MEARIFLCLVSLGILMSQGNAFAADPELDPLGLRIPPGWTAQIVTIETRAGPKMLVVYSKGPSFLILHPSENQFDPARRFLERLPPGYAGYSVHGEPGAALRPTALGGGELRDGVLLKAWAPAIESTNAKYQPRLWVAASCYSALPAPGKHSQIELIAKGTGLPAVGFGGAVMVCPAEIGVVYQPRVNRPNWNAAIHTKGVQEFERMIGEGICFVAYPNERIVAARTKDIIPPTELGPKHVPLEKSHPLFHGVGRTPHLLDAAGPLKRPVNPYHAPRGSVAGPILGFTLFEMALEDMNPKTMGNFFDRQCAHWSDEPLTTGGAEGLRVWSERPHTFKGGACVLIGKTADLAASAPVIGGRVCAPLLDAAWKTGEKIDQIFETPPPPEPAYKNGRGVFVPPVYLRSLWRPDGRELVFDEHTGDEEKTTGLAYAHPKNRGKNQKFYLLPKGNESFLIVSDEGKCLDVHPLDRVNGEGHRIYLNPECHGGSNQVFRFAGDGTIRDLWKGFCLDVSTAGWGVLGGGYQVYSFPCHGGSNQKWDRPPA